MREENKERKYKVMFVKSSTGYFTPRLTLPYSYLRDLNINPGDSVVYSRCENGIVIRKA